MLAPNATLRALAVPQEPEPLAQAAQPTEYGANCAHHWAVQLTWARPLKRLFEIDLEQCSNGGGQLKIVTATLEQPVIDQILAHMDLQDRAPPRSLKSALERLMFWHAACTGSFALGRRTEWTCRKC